MVKSTRFIDVIPDRDAAVSTQLTQTDAWVTATITEQVDSAHVAVHIDGADEDTPDTVAVSDSGVTAIGATVRAYRDSTGRIVRVGIPDEIPAGAEAITVGTTGEWLATLDATASTTSAQVEAAQEKADQAARDALASLEAASKAVTGTTDEYAVGASETVPPTSGWSTTPPVRTPGTFIWVRTTVTYGDDTSSTGSPVLVTGNTGAQGAPGDDGTAGADGVGLTGTSIAYALSTSGTTAPSSGWSSTVPALVKGQYLWTRSVWSYSDGSSETGYSVAYVGTDGSSGTDGLPGKDGVGITGTVIAYAVSASGTTAPSSGWQATPPAASAGQFMWTRTTWTYSDASTEVGYSVGKIGETGATGAAGKGIASTTVTYQASASGTTAPTGTWTATVPTVAAGSYLWTRTVTAYTDSTSTTAYAVGRMGTNGANGTPGAPGADGATTYLHVAYSTAADGSTGFSTTDPSGKTYLGTYTDTTEADSTSPSAYTWVKIQGPTGSTGSTGATGKGIASSTVTYQGSASGTTAPTGTWSSTVPTVAQGSYLWTRTVLVFTDGASTTTYAVARMGVDGEDGATGAAGRGITSTVVTYQASSSGTTVPTGTWTSSIPSVAANQYLWTRTVISYTDGTSTTGYSIGKMGATGADGAAGADGRGIQSTAVTYQAASSGTTIPTGSWSSSIPTVSAGQYLWTRTVITYTDATSSTSYAIGKMGEQGAKGDTGSTGATGTSITSVTTYYRTVTKGAAAPAKPTASPAPSPWTTTEPAYQDNTELYRTDRIVYSTGSFAYTDVSKVSAYTAAAQAITVANLVDQAAKGMVKASATDPGQQEGRIWLVLNASGKMIGIKVSNGTVWTSYTIMADQILVPGSVGTVSIGDSAVTAPKIYATEELWTKILNVAGDATIGGSLLADTIIGKTLRGGLLDGGEIIMRGQSGVQTPYAQQFASSVDSWTGYRQDTATGTQGAFSFTRTGSGDAASYIYSPTYTGGAMEYVYLSARRNISIATAGKKTVSVTFSPIGGQPSAGAATLSANGVVIARYSNASSNDTITLSGITYDAITSLDLTYCFQAQTSFTCSLRVSSVTVTVEPDMNSSVRLYRIADGSPTIDIADINNKVRVRLTAPPDGGSSLTFFDASGNAVTLDDTGVTQAIYQSQAETTPWSQILRPTIAGRRRSTTKQNIASGTWTRHTVAANAGSETWNTGGTVSSGAGIAVPVAGLYQVNASLRFAANANGFRIVGLYVNSTKQPIENLIQAASTGNQMLGLSDVLKLNAGDEVIVGGFQTSNTTITMDEHVLSVTYIGPA